MRRMAIESDQNRAMRNAIRQACLAALLGLMIGCGGDGMPTAPTMQPIVRPDTTYFPCYRTMYSPGKEQCVNVVWVTIYPGEEGYHE